ncbi:MAG: flippase [Methanomassiliicoccus sp.]|nr:flippase [Methanomassiliicoccus sp.]
MVDVQWAFISVVTASLAHFVLRVVLGRELGAEGLGIYTLAFTIYLLGQQFAAFGIGSALTQYVAEHLDDHLTIRKLVSSGMTSSIITGTLMGVVLFLLSPVIANSLFHTPELENMIQLVAFSFPFIAIQKAVLGTLNGFRKMSRFAYLQIAQNVSVVVISIILVGSLHMGELGATVGLVGPTIIVSLLSPLLIREHLRRDGSHWDVTALKITTIFGLYVVLGNAISFLNTQINSILIGYYMTPTEVGIFAVAALLAQVLTLMPSAVQRVTAPSMAAKYGKGDMEGVRRIYYSTLKKSFLITIICASIIAVLGPYIITFFFTNEYSTAYEPLLILLLGYVFAASFGAVGATLSSIGRVNVPFKIGVICTILNIALNVLLIPHMGMNGAAIATAVTLILNFVITIWAIQIYLRRVH